MSPWGRRSTCPWRLLEECLSYAVWLHATGGLHVHGTCKGSDSAFLSQEHTTTHTHTHVGPCDTVTKRNNPALWWQTHQTGSVGFRVTNSLLVGGAPAAFGAKKNRLSKNVHLSQKHINAYGFFKNEIINALKKRLNQPHLIHFPTILKLAPPAYSRTFFFPANRKEKLCRRMEVHHMSLL